MLKQSKNNRSLMRYGLTLAALLLFMGFVLAQVWWAALLCLVWLAAAAYHLTQRSWGVARNYPVLAWVRPLALKLRPYMRAYIVEDDLGGTPYSFEARNLIHLRAKGATDTQPFGTERNTDSSDYHWVSHSMVPCETPETNPKVVVGNEQCSKPYEASVLNVSAMSFGSLSAPAVEALNLAAKKGGFYHDTGEGGISEYHLKHGGDLVWELGSGYFGARDANGNFDPEAFKDSAQLDAVKMTEIKLSQGAKPGHGGMLPASKVTDEIAKIRMVEAHKDCLSPRAHSAFSTPVELLEFAAKLRDYSGGKPVGLKFCVGQPVEVFALVKAMLLTQIYPDYLVVDGGEGGTGAAPQELTDWVGMPLVDGLLLTRNALVGAGIKDKVKLVATGKVYSGMGLAKHMAMGADYCNAARAFMMSIGCVQAQRCHLGTCPTGVATQDPIRARAVVPHVQAQRAARFHAKTVHSLTQITAAAGYAHPSELAPHDLMHRVGVESALPFDRVYHFLSQGVLLEQPEETVYADWWSAASAHSFKPQCDLVETRAIRDLKAQSKVFS